MKRGPQSEPQLPRRSRPDGGLALFVLFASAYALLGRGTFFTSDEGSAFNTGLALLQRGSLAITPGENVRRGVDGRNYANREILPTFITVPFSLAGIVLTRVLPNIPPPVAPLGGRLDGTNWPIFLNVTLLGPLAIAATILWLYEFARDEGASRETALGLATVAGFATPLVVYAKTAFPQVYEAAWLMLAILWVGRWRRTGALSCAAWLGVACGLGLMTRPPFLPVVAAFGTFVALTGRRPWRGRCWALLLFLVPVAIGGVLTGWFNWVRWGSPVEFARYPGPGRFSTAALEGLYGLLLSPGKGLFIFSPVLLMPAAFLRALWRRGRAEVLLLLAISAIYLAVYCRWHAWDGGLCWGPRFLVPLIAPWLALMGRALMTGPWPRRLLVLTALPGAALQLIGVALHPKWMVFAHGEADSLASAYPVVLGRRLLEQGPDDLWLLAERAGPAFGPVVCVLVAAFLVAAAAVRRSASRHGRKAASA
jgi:hypothetical protein